MSKAKIELGSIQETLLITLWARANESNQKNPILVDPKSVEIMSQIEYDFTKLAKANSSQLSICLRGLFFDNWVKEFLNKHPDSIVVEIGAGLSTRFDRIDNNTVQWFNLDLPDAIALRQEFFKDTDRQHSISASILDASWIEVVQKASVGKNVMFIAEGVLIYLSEFQVKELFITLVSQFPESLFAFDSISSLAIKSQKKHDTLKFFNAKFDWSIENIRDLSKWDSRYKILDVTNISNAPQQHLKRIPFGQRLGLMIPKIADCSRLALVQLRTSAILDREVI